MELDCFPPSPFLFSSFSEGDFSFLLLLSGFHTMPFTSTVDLTRISRWAAESIREVGWVWWVVAVQVQKSRDEGHGTPLPLISLHLELSFLPLMELGGLTGHFSLVLLMVKVDLTLVERTWKFLLFIQWVQRQRPVWHDFSSLLSSLLSMYGKCSAQKWDFFLEGPVYLTELAPPLLLFLLDFSSLKRCQMLAGCAPDPYMLYKKRGNVYFPSRGQLPSRCCQMLFFFTSVLPLPCSKSITDGAVHIISTQQLHCPLHYFPSTDSLLSFTWFLENVLTHFPSEHTLSSGLLGVGWFQLISPSLTFLSTTGYWLMRMQQWIALQGQKVIEISGECFWADMPGAYPLPSRQNIFPLLSE